MGTLEIDGSSLDILTIRTETGLNIGHIEPFKDFIIEVDYDDDGNGFEVTEIKIRADRYSKNNKLIEENVLASLSCESEPLFDIFYDVMMNSCREDIQFFCDKDREMKNDPEYYQDDRYEDHQDYCTL